MALINIDSPPIYDTEFESSFENWLTNLTDQINTNIALMPAAVSDDLGGAGAGPIDVTVAGLTSSGVVVATMKSSTNGVGVLETEAALGKFTVTFDADPGASAIINYMVRF